MTLTITRGDGWRFKWGGPPAQMIEVLAVYDDGTEGYVEEIPALPVADAETDDELEGVVVTADDVCQTIREYQP